MAPTLKEHVIHCGGEQYANTYLLSTMKCQLHLIRREQRKDVELQSVGKRGMEEGLPGDGNFSLILET